MPVSQERESSDETAKQIGNKRNFNYFNIIRSSYKHSLM